MGCGMSQVGSTHLQNRVLLKHELFKAGVRTTLVNCNNDITTMKASTIKLEGDNLWKCRCLLRVTEFQFLGRHKSSNNRR